MNKSLLSVLIAAASVPAFAQHQQFTMQEATLGIKTNLAPQNLKQLNWIPGTDAYVYAVGSKEQEALLRTIVPQMKADTLLRLTDINNGLSLSKPLTALPSVEWIKRNECYFSDGNDYYTGTLKNNRWEFSKWCSLPENAENIQVDNHSKQIAYTIDNNLFMVDVYGKTQQISNEPNKDILYGSAKVHRNEFGIAEGIFFSPKGNMVAFYRMDQTMVNNYPIIDWSTNPGKNTDGKYPMAGGTSHEVTLGVYNPITKKTVFLNTGTAKDHYLTCITWSPDEQYIFIAILNREQNHLWLNKYDAKTGAFVNTLFEETDSKYVEPQHALTFLPNSNNEFVWWSQRDGYMHLYHYNTDGKLINGVTKGDWLVNEIVGENAGSKELIITATKESAKEKHIYSVNWNNGKMTLLDNAAGVHTAIVNEAGTYVLDKYQSADVPRNIVVKAVNSKWNKTILQAADPLASYERPKIENVELKADDGTPLYGKIIYPTGFDAHKKYPVIVYLYNGPHVQLITNGFPASGNLWYEYMAQHGYIVFTMDGRGSGNRGLKFEQATFRQLGTAELDDQLKGVDYLKSLPYVDANRMGIHGWSFGGFMTTSMMLRHPGIFKCAVAGGPVIDWSMYEVMYTERYMDTPQENPDGYANNNLLTKVKNLNGKLLMIHGAQDPVVVWQQSMKFVKACVDNGVQLDYFVYPGHEHNVLGKDRVHLMQKITDYFDEYLK
ncbi:prolyl oligopeptidase family serine peptidase [Taibaiella lutea]|uniref:Prolyl oligopeptidase family serine peptidase n=1 Tax=Taibaiella lutea TaxID=2608001 RepID=A0A5M6CNE8_9BACT|nr:DPP IV N-terminal domain-containing protein [Taibaiella lutea]KAA5536587.1 prolyl oligopeptidase family serine peptidase [Taibaiella lutea]